LGKLEEHVVIFAIVFSLDKVAIIQEKKKAKLAIR
jgi:hypothetical protein